MISPDTLAKISGSPVNSNMQSISHGLIASKEDETIGLGVPHRLAHYIAQIGHESGGFKFDEEVASGEAYEGRKDLGNIYPGDGKRFKGRTGIQVTGRYNYREYTRWVKSHISPGAPDFEERPELVNTDPWEGLAPIWYWSSRNLNRYADQNNIEMITKRINGGLNGYADRLRWYTRTALTMLDYTFDENGVRKFQTDSKITVDGDPGPQTRGALHAALKRVNINTEKVTNHALKLEVMLDEIRNLFSELSR